MSKVDVIGYALPAQIRRELRSSATEVRQALSSIDCQPQIPLKRCMFQVLSDLFMRLGEAIDLVERNSEERLNCRQLFEPGISSLF